MQAIYLMIKKEPNSSIVEIKMKLFLDGEIIMLFLCHSTVHRCNALTVSRIIAFYCHHKQIKICDTVSCQPISSWAFSNYECELDFLRVNTSFSHQVFILIGQKSFLIHFCCFFWSEFSITWWIKRRSSFQSFSFKRSASP